MVKRVDCFVASKVKCLRRGVKEVVKALRKGETGSVHIYAVYIIIIIIIIIMIIIIIIMMMMMMMISIIVYNKL